MNKKSKENKRTAKNVLKKALHELRIHKKMYMITLISGVLVSVVSVSLISYACTGKVNFSWILGSFMSVVIVFIILLFITALIDET